jgi:hypothetical protein
LQVRLSLDTPHQCTNFSPIRRLHLSHDAMSVILIAHGPSGEGEAAQWLAHLERVAEGVRGAGAPVAQVHLLRDDAPAEVRRRPESGPSAHASSLLR